MSIEQVETMRQFIEDNLHLSLIEFLALPLPEGVSVRITALVITDYEFYEEN